MLDEIRFQLFLATFCGWVCQRQTRAISYLIEENRVLKEQLGRRRLRLTDDQRRRLAAKGKLLGRKVLQHIASIVTPDTILAWHRRLMAAKWTYPHKRVGRPGVMKEIREVTIRMATENSSWGYARIQGQLKHLGHRVARSTIAKILKEHRIKPSPDRPMSWASFVRAHAKSIAAADFFTTEVWTAHGLVRYYTLFVIDVATRRVEIAGTAAHPTSQWMEQVVRNLTDYESGFLLGKRYLIIDRDTIFSPRFKATLRDASVEILLTAYQAPNMNAYAERFVRAIKSECLDQMVLLGRESLDRAIDEYVAHYHVERSHQGIANELISGVRSRRRGHVHCSQRLGGLLKYYGRRAA